MRTTIELPDDLLNQAKVAAAVNRISLRQFFIEAVHARLAPQTHKVRRPPPVIGDSRSPVMRALTREQVDEALFG